jgi:cyclopropane fatty-acyl-phospholipid synthase-like methyltransferase
MRSLGAFSMECREKLFNEYFDSVYVQSNTFTLQEYQDNAIDFDNDYGPSLPPNKDANILDIGCGTGHFLFYLKTKGYTNFVGIDLSSGQIEFCKNNVTPNVALADAFDFLTDKINYYDTISANDVLEHIPKEKVTTFLEMTYRSLKPGGNLLLKIPNMSNPFAHDARYRDFTHECGFTEKSIYQVLYMAGFRNISIRAPRTQIRSFRDAFSKIIVLLFHIFLRKLFWYQGFTAPDILSNRLIVIVKK